MHIQECNHKCSGCKACINICPVGAIQEERDILGFLYPKIDKEKCFDCGMCEKVCQIDHTEFNNQKEQRFFAGQIKDDRILKLSSSGGIFYALAEQIINDQGCVYGAYFDCDWNVKHGKASNLKEIEKFCGSKYVQSDCSGIYKSIAQDLQDNRKVLFSGTPCQCEGVLKYVKLRGLKDDNLFLVDFLCHGVSSPWIWKQYIAQLTKDRGKIASYTFRNKDLGWKKFRTQIFNVNKEDISCNKYSFFDLYSSLLITRHSCFECNFTSYERCADITLGDFWNIDSTRNDFDVDKGVSQILTNSPKGQKLFERSANRIQVIYCEAKDCWQPHLEYAPEKPSGRDRFEEYYSANSFENVLQKYGRGTFLSKCKKICVPIVRRLGLYELAGKMYKVVLSGSKKN